MDKRIAETLCQLNSRFYAECAASFSSTRSAGWDGWEKLLDELGGRGFSRDGDDTVFTVLDVACGNLRFERFLADALPGAVFDFRCVDNCEALAKEGLEGGSGASRDGDDAHFSGGDAPRVSIHFEESDVVTKLLHEEEPLFGRAQVDLSVSWGFMHHIPTQAARIRFVRAMLDTTRSCGCVALSFWRFAEETERREKALVSTQAGCDELGISRDALEEGDYLLGWQNAPSVFRYCHSFSDDEIGQIVEAVSDRIASFSTFRADGKSGTLNEYVVFYTGQTHA